MNNRYFETLVGALVLIAALAFIWKAYHTVDLGSESAFGTYNLTAKFTRVDGLNPGGDVRIGGIKVGKIIDMTLDPQSFQAIIKMRIKESVKLPADTSAEIIGGMFLGDKYVSLTPGADDQMLKDNSVIEYTQSSISLEGLIGKFMFSSAEKAAATEEAATNATASK